MKKNPEKSEQGKKSRASGQRFEIKVRADLESLGWTVAKWMNTVDYEKNKVVPAKRKYNPFLKSLSIGTGFPDFICFRRTTGEFFPASATQQEVEFGKNKKEEYDVIGLEVKGNGYLDPVERGMCIWLLENRIFSRILIAKKAKEKGKIEYIDFSVKYKSQ